MANERHPNELFDFLSLSLPPWTPPQRFSRRMIEKRGFDGEIIGV